MKTTDEITAKILEDTAVTRSVEEIARVRYPETYQTNHEKALGQVHAWLKPKICCAQQMLSELRNAKVETDTKIHTLNLAFSEKYDRGPLPESAVSIIIERIVAHHGY